MFSKCPIADVALLLSDPARVAMLTSLLDGEARPAGELARIAGLSPQAASAHLAKLTDGQLLTLVREGRHHYYRMAKPEVGIALEALAVINPLPKRSTMKESAEHQALRFARTCYDHLAGQMAVQLMSAFVDAGFIMIAGSGLHLTERGDSLLHSLEIDPALVRNQRRPLAKACLDWTERKYHISGALGGVLLTEFCARDWIVRHRRSRAVRVTESGRREIEKRMGIHLEGWA
jgi:DNA-binding transcriptional ArsR family regulator